ncbi:ATP-binding protein, partial [Klebsiella pneumoniae]|uniref:sensor histidine kinase n=1 Tax=Klebsiella pneumoniae TaxID=573 RepID=UPI00226E3ECD
DVEELIASVVKSETRAADKRAHDLSVEPSRAIAPVCADAKALRRVLSNVIENAIKYTPDRGRLIVSAHEADGQVAISVKDNG